MELDELVLKELDIKRMEQTVKELGCLHRYSGQEGGEKAADYFEEKLEEMGIPVEMCSYEGYFSIPVKASLKVFGMDIPLIGDVYSREAEELTGELFYDRDSEKKTLSSQEKEQRFQAFNQKIVLSWDGKGDFARKAMAWGAKAVIHICKTKGDYNHHSNIGTVWGTPSLEDQDWMQFLPSAGIRRQDGEKLIHVLKEKTPEKGELAQLTVSMNTGVKRSRFPVVQIPGKRKEFILVSGHYDSWYEGITDNACSDAVMLEYARILWEHREELERGVRIAWWSGHSDGRFSGSAWYCDTHFQELSEDCMAHINLDLTGCRNADQVSVRTTCMEGLSYTADLIEKYTGRRPDSYIPMIRGADQSFWGANIPVTIMLKYEPLPENRLSDCPSGGPWWHTDKDTLDKMDLEILMRDARMNGEMLCDMVQNGIPSDMTGFLCDMEDRLKLVSESYSENNALNRVERELEALKERISDYEKKRKEMGKRLPDQELKKTAGVLNQLFYSAESRYVHPKASQFGPLAGFPSAVKAAKDPNSELHRLMAETSLIRQANRLEDGMRQVESFISALQSLPLPL